MKALVLAGGAGTRLRPLSHSTPKQLVPVAGRPVLFHALDELRAIGVREAGVIISEGRPGEQIRAAAGDGSRFGLDITYLPQDAPRGLAHCVIIAREFLADDDFVMYLGDNIFAGGLGEPLAAFRSGAPAAQLVVTKVADPSAYGIAELDAEGRVTALQEKPAVPRSDLAVTGAYFFTPRIHEAVRGILPSARGELEITDAIQWLVTRGHPVRADRFSGYWADTGTLADVLTCNKVLLDDLAGAVRGVVDRASELTGQVVVEQGAEVIGSVIDGPVIIGAGSVIEDSRVGPFTSIGSGCRLRGAGVENSILLDQASVHGVRTIQGSIIGKAGDVRRQEDGSTMHRLLVGDDSRIDVPA
ncbi:glucose-1-phosphate thymidylyltransferase [Streptomyces sulfonofaciens]|uniref:Glucose-1-phosphate thymidylyltransferase n=1 Tax=Streptomyces sulfonofaciens TaxID=68272 RepID=A0A919L010_9ACTN|nr:glucose-1-phosphate thymidylyltransferase [Streptomyces sulfonofaciens]GHH78972.1 glucose-1-phosphate thymidylyltransferase [Streptomyces sulfonofaciens]